MTSTPTTRLLSVASNIRRHDHLGPMRGPRFVVLMAITALDRGVTPSQLLDEYWQLDRVHALFQRTDRAEWTVRRWRSLLRKDERAALRSVPEGLVARMIRSVYRALAKPVARSEFYIDGRLAAYPNHALMRGPVSAAFDVFASFAETTGPHCSRADGHRRRGFRPHAEDMPIRSRFRLDGAHLSFNHSEVV